MNYQEWLKNDWLRPHPPTPEEIAGLRAVVERDLKASARSACSWVIYETIPYGL